MKNVALITGASTGIGKELATIHASKGGDLIIIARNEHKLNQLKQEFEKKYNIKAVVIAKDLSDLSAPNNIYNEVKKQGIEIDYLINNAGFGALGKFYELDLERQISMINLNVTALTKEITEVPVPAMFSLLGLGIFYITWVRFKVNVI